MGLSFKGIKFASFVVLIEIIFIVVIGFFGYYPDASHYPDIEGLHEQQNVSEAAEPDSNFAKYPNFQDVNVMIFVGFGFLMTFLKNYGFSSVGLNMLVSVVSIQWAAIVRGFIYSDVLAGEKFQLTLFDMVTYNFATATVLISFGAVLGKVSPIQLLVMAIIEIFLAQLNEYVGVDFLHVRDLGESIFIHTFGAYFGLAVSRVLHKEDIENSSKEGSVYHSDIFAMIGTLFLWLYWPSFNGGFADDQQQRDRAYLNTFLSLCACTAITFAVSALVHKEDKFNMVHIQNSTLAGGVAVGATANMPMQPFGAMIFGSVAGTISVLGYKYLTPALAKKLKIHDTCGVNNLHGMPGLLAAIGSAFLAAMSSSWSHHDQVTLFPETFPVNSNVIGALGRSPGQQAGYQFLAAVITLGVAVGGGLLTGLFLKLPIWNEPQDGQLFEDADNWDVPEGETLVTGTASTNHYKVHTTNQELPV